MTRPQVELQIVVEGPTEEGFVKRVLKPHLDSLGLLCRVQIVTTSRSAEGRRSKGGGDWTKWKKHIQLLLRDKRPNIRVTTLFDLYGLPADFPETDEDVEIPRIERLERAMEKSFNDPRFIGYLQRHEFEALVLAALPELEQILEDKEDRRGLQKLQDDIRGLQPEDVNEKPESAPSKRLARFIPSYAPRDRKSFKGPVGKSYYGPLVAEKAGLARLRERCPRFSAWVERLEKLV